MAPFRQRSSTVSCIPACVLCITWGNPSRTGTSGVNKQRSQCCFKRLFSLLVEMSAGTTLALPRGAWPCWAAPSVLPNNGYANTSGRPTSSPRTGDLDPSLGGLQHVWFYCSFHFHGSSNIIASCPEWKCGNKTRRVFWGGISAEIPNKKYWAANDKVDSSLFAHLRAANEVFQPQRVMKFLQRNFQVIDFSPRFLARRLLCSLVCRTLRQGSGVSLLLHPVPRWFAVGWKALREHRALPLRNSNHTQIGLAHLQLSHLFYNNNFKSNVLEKEMNKHKTCKRGKLMWDFRQVIYLPFWLSAIL